MRLLTSALERLADSSRTSRHVGKGPILLQKSFGGDERNFLGPLMGLARRDVRDHVAYQEKTMELRIGPAGLCSGREVEKSSFARFSRPFDFRVLQHCRPSADRRQTGHIPPRNGRYLPKVTPQALAWERPGREPSDLFQVTHVVDPYHGL